LAGASGVIGRRLAPLLLDAGYKVFGTTRSIGKAATLEAAGIEPIVVDAFDGVGLSRAMGSVGPEIVIHQLTDLPCDPGRITERLAANARLRSEGTQNLVAAALEVGARRLVAQSIAWAYAPGTEPHCEEDPLDLDADGTRGITVGGILALERFTLLSPPLTGVVLRYGFLYGPGTWRDQPTAVPALHVDAAAFAALLAAESARAGIFNIAEPNEMVRTEKARRELGWNPDFRLGLGGQAPEDSEIKSLEAG